MATTKKRTQELAAKDREKLLTTLKARFEKHMHRHSGLKWTSVQARLDAHPDKLWSLNEMEKSGGEPDVIGHDKKSGAFIFYDCSPESPKGRRSTCYDREARVTRADAPPRNSAVEMAEAMGIDILTEAQYRDLQQLGEFDTKTSSWVQTPSRIRSLGGATFCDRRYDTVFLYHNGAQSYYAARGFRASLTV